MATIISHVFINLNSAAGTTPVAVPKVTTLRPKATAAKNLKPKPRKTTGVV